MEDTVSVSVLDVRTAALEMAISAAVEGEADEATIKRASLFYEWIRETAIVPPAPKTAGNGGVLPFKGNKH